MPELAPLPQALHADAVALWRASGLTRPWNDAGADLRRALRGPDYEHLGYSRSDVVVLGRRLDTNGNGVG